MDRFLRIVAPVCLLFLAGCSDPINQKNFDRIQVGMTLKEVEAIMGRRPESYQTFKTWRGSNSRTISVEIDDREIVVNKTRDGW